MATISVSPNYNGKAIINSNTTVSVTFNNAPPYSANSGCIIVIYLWESGADFSTIYSNVVTRIDPGTRNTQTITYTFNPYNIAVSKGLNTSGLRIYVSASAFVDSINSDENDTAIFDTIFPSKLDIPGSCRVNKTATPTGPVTLSWGAVYSTVGNDRTYYEVQRSESSNGSTGWSSWTTLSNTLTTNSLSVYPPSTKGNYYRYQVRALGNAGNNYHSEYRISSNTLRNFHEALPAFTDSTLISGQTYVKAVHITELQTGVNSLRSYYGLSSYSFSPVEKIADWTKHVTELRAAVDGISTNHDTWLDISVNCPRVDVMKQLRTIILAL